MVDQQICIMFSDVAGSTQLYDLLGDAAAEKCIADCLEMMSKAVNKNSGHVIKTIGDEIMARFDNADDAYMAAKQIQFGSETIHTLKGKSIQVRIGMHMGHVIEKENDIFGDAVNIAARISGVAKGGQIMLSEALFANLGELNQSSCRLFDYSHVKGKEQALNIYQVVWEEFNQTNIITAHGGTIGTSKGGLVLAYAGKEVFISNSEGTKPYIVGREPSCDLIIESSWASRSHLEIVWKRDKYILTDHSTNGTTVKQESGDSIYLKRESYPLVGKGTFMLGIDEEHIIRFEVLDSI